MPRKTDAPQASASFIPSGEVAVALKAVELGAKGAKALHEWLMAEGPLVAQILESEALTDQYLLRLRLMNQTVHGMYLLGASMSFPFTREKLEIFEPRGERMTFGGAGREKPQALELPCLLRTARPQDIYFLFPRPKPSHLSGGPLEGGGGKITLDIHLLSKKAAEPKHVKFAIILPP